MLHSRLRPLPPPHSHHSIPATAKDDEIDETPEDLFAAFLPHLFPDESPSFHGDPGQHLLYSSPRYGDLEIMVPTYPSQSEERSAKITAGSEKKNGLKHVDERRKLFAHFLWSAAMVVAAGVEDADRPQTSPETVAHKEAHEMWSVRGETVLELGAGAALPSLVCALANASTVVATDHPSSPALSGAITFNMEHNLRNRHTPTKISIHPHEWGTFDDIFARQSKGTFTRIIAADCFWMRSQHENLVRSLQWFLAPGGKVWVVAGFHTGRAIVAGFFETALDMGFEIERIFERDLVLVKEDGEEIRREWVPVREGEGPENRRRWCLVAVLRRRK